MNPWPLTQALLESWGMPFEYGKQCELILYRWANRNGLTWERYVRVMTHYPVVNGTFPVT